MRILVNFMILCGIIIMVSNIYRYVCFMKRMTDVMSAGKKKDDILQKIALSLLIFFLIGYIGIGLLSIKNILIGCILFGAVFLWL